LYVMESNCCYIDYIYEESIFATEHSNCMLVVRIKN